MKGFMAWRTSLFFLLTFKAVALVTPPQRGNLTLAASPSNLSSPNTLVPCCAGLMGGYNFGGFYGKGEELTQPNDKYLREMMDLLVPFGNTYTKRGKMDLAYFEDFGQVTVRLEMIMDPPGSDSLTYEQCAQALGYLAEVLEGDIFEPDSIKSAVLLHVSVGNNRKIFVTVLEDSPEELHTYAGDKLELASVLYQTRPISRMRTEASLADVKAGYIHYPPAAPVPQSFTQIAFHAGVRYKIWMELDDGEQQWPYFTFTDLVVVVGRIQVMLEGAPAPSADSWAALYAKIVIPGINVGVGFVRLEPIYPGVNLLTSENSTQPTISRPGISSGLSQVDVT